MNENVDLLLMFFDCDQLGLEKNYLNKNQQKNSTKIL